MAKVIRLLKIYCPNFDNPTEELWSINVTNTDSVVYFRPGVTNISDPTQADTYRPDLGFEDFSISIVSDLSPTAFDVELYNNEKLGLPTYVIANLHQFQTLRFFYYIWDRQQTSQPILFLAGKVGEVQVTPRQIKFSLVDRLNDLVKSKSRRYDTTCGHNFGDNICRIDLATNPIAGLQSLTITGGNPSVGQLDVSGLLTDANNARLYQAGFIRITDPLYPLISPIKWDIAQISGSTIYLWDMLLGVGTDLTAAIISPDCYGSIDDCKAWNNVENYGGFVHMISSDQFFSPTLNNFTTT